VRASQLPDEFSTVFSQVSANVGTVAGAGQRAISAALPKSGTFSANCFRNIVNDSFADSDTLIVSESSKATQAEIPSLIQTMELINDDNLSVTYDEMIYLITGYYPKNNKSENLTSRINKAALVTPSLVIPTTGDPTLAGMYGVVHKHSFQRNYICIEPTWLCLVVAMWEQPNSESIYNQVGLNEPVSWAAERFQGATTSSVGKADNGKIDRGEHFTVDEFRNLNAWMVDPTSDDPVGDLDSDSISLNYWLNGDVQFDYDWDPIVITGGTDAGSSVTVTPESASAEGAEAFISNVHSHIGISTLQGFPD
jgi:hypothetical protein